MNMMDMQKIEELDDKIETVRSKFSLKQRRTKLRERHVKLNDIFHMSVSVIFIIRLYF